MFGDGSISYLVGDDGNCEVINGMEYTWKNSLSLMGWGVENDQTFSFYLQELTGKKVIT